MAAHDHRARRLAGAMGALLAALALVAGCGSDDEGGGSDATDTQEWADGICTSLSTWEEAITAIVANLRQNPSRTGVQDAVGEAKSATETLADDLRDLGRPDTEAGAEAEQTVDDLSSQLQDGVQTVENAVEEAEGGSGVLNAISVASSTLATMGRQVSSAVEELVSLEPGEELESAFADSDACQALRSQS
jgi:methyl-accepting chemotaxis protein